MMLFVAVAKHRTDTAFQIIPGTELIQGGPFPVSMCKKEQDLIPADLTC